MVARRLKSLSTRLFVQEWFGMTTNKAPKLRIADFVKGIHPWPVDFADKGPVLRKASGHDVLNIISE